MGWLWMLVMCRASVFASIVLMAALFLEDSALGQGSLLPGEIQSSGIGLALQNFISKAVNTYPSIAAARSSLTASSVDLKAAKWARFPSVSLQVSALANSDTTIGSLNQKNIQPAATVDQPLWTGGVISGTIERVSLQQQSALAAVGEAVLDVELQVAESYFEVLRQLNRQSILRNSLSEHHALVEMMQRRVQQEVSAKSDLDLVNSRAAQIQQQLSGAVAAYNVSLQHLKVLVGEANLDPLLFDQPNFSQPLLKLDLLIDDALAFSPKRQRLQAEVLMAGVDAEIKRAELMPKLSLQYSYDDIYRSRVGLVVKSQLIGGLSGLSAAEASRLRRQSIALQLETTEYEIRNQMFADYEEYQLGSERLIVATSAAESARRISGSYMRQFTSGIRTWLDLMNAVREASAAELEVVDINIQTQLSLTKMVLHSGRWRVEFLGGG